MTHAIIHSMTTVFGVPAHPLLIHIPVVFIPLTVLGIVVSAVWPRVLQTYGWMIVAAAVVSTLGAVAATLSGAQLFASLDRPEALEQHQHWGEITRALSIALAALTAAWWWYGRRPDGSGTLAWTLRIAVVVVALATLTAVVYTGHLGARAVWGGIAG